jgi:hypothetical protein
MAKAKKKLQKKAADTYEPKLKIHGSFADVIAVSVGKKVEKKETP